MKQFGRTILTVMGLLMVALVLLLTLTLCGPAAVAQSSVFHANGAFADTFSPCAIPGLPGTSTVCMIVEVSTASASGPTNLFYDLFILDNDTGISQETSGNGTIPNSAFQVQGNRAALNVDTSTVANFVNTLCIVDNGGPPNCSSVPGGVVTSTWTAITQIKSRMSGSNHITTPGTNFNITGTSTSHPAITNMNSLGVALANVAGSVGTNHNTTISIFPQH